MNLSEVVFLLFFLPLAFFCFSFWRGEKKTLPLLLFSLIFYLWGGIISLLGLLFIALIARLFGGWIRHCREKGKKGSFPFAVGTVLLLLPLTWFRYLQDICLPTLQRLLPELPIYKIAVPFALAFVTIKGISVLLEVKRGETLPTFGETLLFCSLFINGGGPAVCLDEFRGVMAAASRPDLKNGCYLFAWGLCKKLILAESLSILWKDLEKVTPSYFTTVTVLLFTLSYFVSVCTGLSAYSDMAEGLGLMFGLPFRKNTDAPLLSVSVAEFWRRFLPGVRRFFSVAVELPLRRGEKSGIRAFFAVMLSYALMGLFFGGEWGFLFFGLTFGMAAFLEERVAVLSRLPFPLRRAMTLLTAVFAFSFCRWDSADRWLELTEALFGANGFVARWDGYMAASYWLIFLLSVLFGLRLFEKIGYRFYKNHPRIELAAKPIATVVLVLLSMAFFGNIYESAYIFLPL